MRRETEKSLPKDFNGKQWIHILERFDGKCALSNSTDISVEHVVPIHWCHLGTHINNTVPMDVSLNYSKGTKNIFEWIKQPEINERVDSDKFKDLIRYLALMNDLSPEEYEEFVYWAEANKRTLKDVKQDPRPSVDIYKEQRGIS